MSNEGDEYVLGEDITKAAEGKQRKGTVVLSVRLTAEELAAVESYAVRAEKNVSQVIREAIRNCLQVPAAHEPVITVSVTRMGPTSTYGTPRMESRGAATDKPWFELGEPSFAVTG